MHELSPPTLCIVACWSSFALLTIKLVDYTGRYEGAIKIWIQSTNRLIGFSICASLNSECLKFEYLKRSSGVRELSDHPSYIHCRLCAHSYLAHAECERVSEQLLLSTECWSRSRTLWSLYIHVWVYTPNFLIISCSIAYIRHI